MSLRFRVSDGKLVRVETITTEAPIHERTVARYRLLHHLAAVGADGAASTWEEALVGWEDYGTPEAIASPFWADYEDLHFAQVLFHESLGSYVGPWGDLGIDPEDWDRMLVADKQMFVDDVREWCLRGRVAAGPSELAAWQAAAQAALELDAPKLRAIVEKQTAIWKSAVVAEGASSIR